MPGLDEKRGTQGQQNLKAGTISFDGSGIDCLVRKMSGYDAFFRSRAAQFARPRPLRDPIAGNGIYATAAR